MDISIIFESVVDSPGLLIKWLVKPRDKVVNGQTLAFFLIPSAERNGNISKISSESNGVVPLDSCLPLLSTADGFVKEICVLPGDFLTPNLTLLVLKPASAVASSSTGYTAPSEQLRHRDTPRYSHQIAQQRHTREISQEISRLSRKRRTLEFDLMKKIHDESELLNESNLQVALYLELDRELSARETEKRRELMDIFRFLKQRRDLNSGTLSPTIDISKYTHLSDDLPIWGIAPLKYTPTTMDSLNDRIKSKELAAFDCPDEEERDCEVPGHMLGRITSTYPWLKSNDEREGDPICDHLAARIFENRFFLAIADGCNWGPAPAEAAKRATQTFLNTMISHHEAFGNTQQIGQCILDAISAAHDCIMIDHSDIFAAGTTTLLGGVLIQLNKLDEKGQPTWAFVYGSVGDCVAADSWVSLGHVLARPVQRVLPGTPVASWSAERDAVRGHDSSVEYVINKGLKQCVRLALPGSLDLQLTPEHRVLATLRARRSLDWIPAGELVVGHKLLRQLTVSVQDDPAQDDAITFSSSAFSSLSSLPVFHDSTFHASASSHRTSKNNHPNPKLLSWAPAHWSLSQHRDHFIASARLLAYSQCHLRNLVSSHPHHHPLPLPHLHPHHHPLLSAHDLAAIDADLRLIGGWHTLQPWIAQPALHDRTRWPRFMRREYEATLLGLSSQPLDLLQAFQPGACWVEFATLLGVRYSLKNHLFLSIVAHFFMANPEAQQFPSLLRNPSYLNSFVNYLGLVDSEEHDDNLARLPTPPAHHHPLDEVDQQWLSWLIRSEFDLQANSFLVPLLSNPIPLPAPLPVYDLCVPVHENFLANSLVVHNCKAFVWSKMSRNITDITESGRSAVLNAKDCGGRIGPYFHTGQPDLRNLDISVTQLYEGDMLILCSDGVHDNLDPIQLGLHPSDLDLEGEKWDDIDPSILHEAQTRFRCEFLQSRIFGNLTKPSPVVVCSRIINHCVELTTAAREFLEREPESILPTDYQKYPGKMDHTSCLAISVTTLNRRRDDDASVPTPIKKPSMMKTTSARLTTAFRSSPRARQPVPSVLTNDPRHLAVSAFTARPL